MPNKEPNWYMSTWVSKLSQENAEECGEVLKQWKKAEQVKDVSIIAPASDIELKHRKKGTQKKIFISIYLLNKDSGFLSNISQLKWKSSVKLTAEK